MGSRVFKVSLGVVFIVFLLFVFFSSSLFAISRVEIFGNNRVTTQEIKSATGASAGLNILSFNSRKAKKELLQNNYIERVTIEKDFLKGNLSITVKERVLSGYIEHSSGSFLYIDEKGRVLDVKSSYAEKMPIVVGLKFTEFQVGQVLQVSNQISFDNLVVLAQLFNKYEVEADVIKVDLSDSQDIKIYWGSVSVSFGSISDADEKIRTIKAIIERLDDEDIKEGFLDIKDINKTPIFKYLT